MIHLTKGSSKRRVSLMFDLPLSWLGMLWLQHQQPCNNNTHSHVEVNIFGTKRTWRHGKNSERVVVMTGSSLHFTAFCFMRHWGLLFKCLAMSGEMSSSFCCLCPYSQHVTMSRQCPPTTHLNGKTFSHSRLFCILVYFKPYLVPLISFSCCQRRNCLPFLYIRCYIKCESHQTLTMKCLTSFSWSHCTSGSDGVLLEVLWDSISLFEIWEMKMHWIERHSESLFTQSLVKSIDISHKIAFDTFQKVLPLPSDVHLVFVSGEWIVLFEKIVVVLGINFSRLYLFSDAEVDPKTKLTVYSFGSEKADRAKSWQSFAMIHFLIQLPIYFVGRDFDCIS